MSATFSNLWMNCTADWSRPLVVRTDIRQTLIGQANIVSRFYANLTFWWLFNQSMEDITDQMAVIQRMLHKQTDLTQIPCDINRVIIIIKSLALRELDADVWDMQSILLQTAWLACFWFASIMQALLYERAQNTLPRRISTASKWSLVMNAGEFTTRTYQTFLCCTHRPHLGPQQLIMVLDMCRDVSDLQVYVTWYTRTFC